MATGCASYDEFCRNVDAFLKLSGQIKDNWQRASFEDASHQVIPYIVKKNVLRQVKRSQTVASSNTTTLLSTEDSTEDQPAEDEAGVEDDDAETTLTEKQECSTSEVHQYEYHILYSSSYSVPVLYFTACKPDGKLVSLEDVWQAIPEYYQARLQHQRWTFITQQEHPYLGRPFYQLHPCHSADLMKAVLPQGTDAAQKRVNYLVTWLSSVGPVVGLSLPLAYSQLCDMDR